MGQQCHRLGSANSRGWVQVPTREAGQMTKPDLVPAHPSLLYSVPCFPYDEELGEKCLHRKLPKNHGLRQAKWEGMTGQGPETMAHGTEHPKLQIHEAADYQWLVGYHM
jgi:hypothetical protein